MERLEAAISKARAQQAGKRGQTGARTTPMSGDALAARWAALPEITFDRQVLSNSRIVTTEPAVEGTPFDILRTRTLRMMQENGWKRLAITSPTPECGKSTISLNLALSISRQSALRTMSIELDMRRPSQNRLLGIKGDGISANVAALLSGEVAFEDVAMRSASGLAFVTSSASQKNASDILLDDNVSVILDQIEEEYQPDIMVFDMPPALLSDDTQAFLKHVDCALIIAAAESSSVAEIDRCEREVASQTDVLGVVLNKTRLTDKNQGYYGYY